MVKGNKNKIKRSSLSGKIVNDNPVILRKEAIEYLKKQGYLITHNKKAIPIEKAIEKLKENGFKIIPESILQNIKTFTTLFISLGALNLLNSYYTFI